MEKYSIKQEKYSERTSNLLQRICICRIFCYSQKFGKQGKIQIFKKCGLPIKYMLIKFFKLFAQQADALVRRMA